jgi:hypothetical protein
MTKVPPRVNEGGLPLPLGSETVTGAWLGGQEDDISDTELNVGESCGIHLIGTPIG